MLSGVAALLFSPLPSIAGPNNIDITGLMDSNGKPNDADFEGLAKELGNVIASVNLAPAETLGLSGFDFYSIIPFTTLARTVLLAKQQPNRPF